ncbi:MAG: hypothetical protein R2748_27420 [Bryobacterales bacterium]
MRLGTDGTITNQDVISVQSMASAGPGRIVVTGLAEPGVIGDPRLSPPGSLLVGVVDYAPTDAPLPRLDAVVNAGDQLGHGLSGQTVVSLYGQNLAAETRAATAEGGSFPVELGGVRVLVGGVAAPLLFVSPNQINAVTPSGLGDGELVSVMLEGGAPSNVLSLTSIPALPVPFQSGERQVIALDQEGRLITEQNPVKRGEIAVLWATAVGAMAPKMADGAVAPLAPPFPQAPITGVAVDFVPAQILYAGAAPDWWPEWHR